MTETIKVSESLELHAVAENHVTPLYQLICKNKTWLQQSLNWPQFCSN
ncbi:ribosomal-protein-serine N-acetyltransferase [Escherichia coli]|uniref:Ribosomal-protein-serine N-acetyltransferase n=1 Tax=Escherichia coli TaxID=562 RepID=A0A447XXS0_ECOLX|nr:ribosomal-protein-serine N-acetyltransferase [Escherichia coli]